MRTYELNGMAFELDGTTGICRCNYDDTGLLTGCFEADELAEWAWSAMGRRASEHDAAALAMAAAAEWDAAPALTPPVIAEQVHLCAVAWRMAEIAEG